MASEGQNDIYMGEAHDAGHHPPPTFAQSAGSLFTAPNPLPDQPQLVRVQPTTQPPTISKGAFRHFPVIRPARPPNDPNPRPAKRPREYEENSDVGPSAQHLPQTSPVVGHPPNMSTLEAGLIDATRQIAQPRQAPARPQSDIPPLPPHSNPSEPNPPRPNPSQPNPPPDRPQSNEPQPSPPQLNPP
ncbi:hypothetical protein FRC08_007743 [Ceratobasidium sp. 394]|nr:hypothetical protein FRC08_007743 [Ceratobasidium sp. 394]